MIYLVHRLTGVTAEKIKPNEAFFLILLFISSPACAQDITGSWSWNSEDRQTQFSLDLKKENKEITGTHCAVFYGGDRIDCSENSENEVSVKLVQRSEHLYEGSIKSDYSQTTGKIRLEYNPEEKNLKFQLLKEPSGIFYLPKEVVLH